MNMNNDTVDLFSQDAQKRISEVREDLQELPREICEDMTDYQIITTLMLQAFFSLDVHAQNILIAKASLEEVKCYTQIARVFGVSKQQLSLVVADAKRKIREHVIKGCKEFKINLRAFKFAKLQLTRYDKLFD